MGVRTDLLKLADEVVGRPLCTLVGAFGAAPRRVAPPSGGSAGDAGDATTTAPATTPATATPQPERVLVIRPGGIGDAVLMLPMVDALRAAWPGAAIELLAERRNAAAVSGSGRFAAVHLYDQSPWATLVRLRGRFELVIDTEQSHALSALVARATGAARRIGFDTNARRAAFSEVVRYRHDRHEVESFLDLAAVATGVAVRWDPEIPSLRPSADAARAAAERLAALRQDGGPLISIHPGASVPERRWGASRFAAVARGLVAAGASIVLVGGHDERAAASAVASCLPAERLLDTVGRAGLEETAALLAACDLHLGADSGLLHLAAAAGTPTLALFGAGIRAKWAPRGTRHRVVARDLPCSPCTRFGATPPCNQRVLCLEQIDPAEVLRVAQEQLAAVDPRPSAATGN